MSLARKGGFKLINSYKTQPNDQISDFASYGSSCQTYGLA